MSDEKKRLLLAYKGRQPWQKWGSYLPSRQWATVREDYSPHGTAWEYFSHDAARSRAYRWGEDGIGGFCDDQLYVCLAPAFWNGRDPILKERLFGLTGNQGNHGEDVKEVYFYLDGTPTHSYMKMLYKYPQAAFPYSRLVEENRRRDRSQSEFELVDTGIFDDDRYFDIFIEYAKAAPEDFFLRVTAFNRGRQAAPLTILPQLWFRNTWSWDQTREKPLLKAGSRSAVEVDHPELGSYRLYLDGQPRLLFCDNETNGRRLFGLDDSNGYFKDAIDDFVVHGAVEAVNPDRTGTKLAAYYPLQVPPGGSASVQVRFSPESRQKPFQDADTIFDRRHREADDFYRPMQAKISSPEARRVQRQALAGMLWSKQVYNFDVGRWLGGDPTQPPPPAGRRHGRNHEWEHLNGTEVFSMPDNWEYPWFAAWDLAFHCIPLAMIDPDFAKSQLVHLTREWYMHPNGQMPAYEWAFGDVNPPVHAWAAWRVYKIDEKLRNGRADLSFLERVFHKLLLNFTWWVNRKDEHNHNIFQGGFLGLDNIGVFDRSAELPTGGHIEQADATSWMAMYCLNLMRMALELAELNPVYQDLGTKFFEHFLYIAGAMRNIGGKGIDLWDEEDEFFYDVLHCPGGDHVHLKVRSIVGLIPLFAVETLEPDLLERLPEFDKRLNWFLENRSDLAGLVSRWCDPGSGERRLLSLLRGHRMKCLLRRMLDEEEFLSPYGVRALSRYHRDHPYVFNVNGNRFTVNYEPGESESGLFGGNSNWRGPIWLPVNFLIVEALQRFHHYYGDDFKVECPTRSGNFLTIEEVAAELSRRLCRLFFRDGEGRRPIYGQSERFQSDPNFRDYLYFHEYFHGEDGHGLGACHQTGWTGLVAKLLQPRRSERKPRRRSLSGRSGGCPEP